LLSNFKHKITEIEENCSAPCAQPSVFFPQSATMDGGAFANGRMDAPLSDKEQKIRLFPLRALKVRPLWPVTLWVTVQRVSVRVLF